jgi:hypothetical protein
MRETNEDRKTSKKVPTTARADVLGMAQTARERRAAQRQNARIQAANRGLRREQQTRILDSNVRQAVFNARVNWANDVMSGREPMPAPGTAEAKNLASLASYASRGQADPRFEAAFSRYWYHNKEANMGPDAETYEEGNENDVMEDEEDEE